MGGILPPGLGIAMPKMRQPNSKFGINSGRLRSITGKKQFSYYDGAHKEKDSYGMLVSRA